MARKKWQRSTFGDPAATGDASSGPKLSPPLHDRKLKPFPFLKLPAEVRNMVYDLASEESVDDKDRDVYGPPSLTKRYIHQTPAGSFSSSRRVFLGLTQVCRQLRSEFRPLYIERNEVCVRADESADYIKLMWQLAAEGAPTRGLITRVAADVSLGMNIDVDVLPILKVCGNRTAISARFFSRRVHSMSVGVHKSVNTDLKALFTEDRSKWLSFYNEHLSQVTLTLHKNLPLVAFYFKEGFNFENVVELYHMGRYKQTMMLFGIIEASGGISWDDTSLPWLIRESFERVPGQELSHGMHDFDDWYGRVGNRRVVSK
ncbi:hypothetical protein SLS60_002248 [Paraconiothyrium brasiliense]|uniref:Uncharacterized protein n=1 Tax=Paraconiothyrium brasiliense TaxID=300254 RepID=A0ABR3S261_9PLEO